MLAATDQPLLKMYEFCLILTQATKLSFHNKQRKEMIASYWQQKKVGCFEKCNGSWDGCLNYRNLFINNKLLVIRLGWLHIRIIGAEMALDQLKDQTWTKFWKNWRNLKKKILVCIQYLKKVSGYPRACVTTKIF